MNNNKKIGAVVLAYNQEDYILDALFSLENQKVKLDELIIIDDFSTDNTKKIIGDFISLSKNIKKIIYIDREENIGINKNLIAAINASTADILILQAGDDMSSPERVGISKKILENSVFNVINSSYSIINEKGVITKVVTRNGFYSNVLPMIRKGAALPNYGIAFKREFIIDIINTVGFDSLLHEDDFIGFCSIYYGGLYISEVELYSYRVHDKSFSAWARHSLSMRDYLNNTINSYRCRVENLNLFFNKINLTIDGSFDNSENIELYKCIENKLVIYDSIINKEKYKILDLIRIIFLYRRDLSIQDASLILFGRFSYIFMRYGRLIRLKF